MNAGRQVHGQQQLSEGKRVVTRASENWLHSDMCWKESNGLLKDRMWVARERRHECDIPQGVFTNPLDPFRSKEMDTWRFSAHVSGPLGIRFEPWLGCPEAAAFCPVAPGACVAAEPGVTHRDC